MPGDELTRLTAREIARAVRSRSLSAAEVVEAHLDRISRLDGRARACITVLGERAMAAARRVDREPAGALAGVPVGVKDQIDVAGIPTTNGSAAFAGAVAPEDATVVRRVVAAGGVVVAKLNMSELALGGTREPHWGAPANPWDPSRTAGESSGGSAVALATGMCAVSIAEDTGGSARGPAAYCGVVALRPTVGRVSGHGVTPLSPSMDTVAPMGRTVGDCALAFAAIAGTDPDDPRSGRSVADLRVGVVRELLGADALHPDVRTVFETAVSVLRDLGVAVEEVSVPLAPFAGAIFVALADADGAAIHRDLLRERPHLLDAATRARLWSALLLPEDARERARRARATLARQMHAAMERVHALVSPTSPFPPPPHADLTAPFALSGDMATRFFFRRSYPACWSLARLPAVSVPCGLTPERLPVGLQIGGRASDEPTLLAIAQAYERATPWHRMRPPLADGA